MCIIAIKPKGKKMFTDDQLRTMFNSNPDGCGYMYVYDGKVAVRKGFMAINELLDDLKKNGQIENATEKNIVFHFRIGTSGFYDELNCHPYPIYQKNATRCRTDIAIAHNGILHAYTPSRNSDINDTQVFIQTVLRKLKKGFQYDKDKLLLIEQIIGTNKFTILDENDKLTLIGEFITDNGYIYSNKSYMPKIQKSVSKGTARSWIHSSFWADDEPNEFWDDFDMRHPQ